jgi:hypothetical protein
VSVSPASACTQSAKVCDTSPYGSTKTCGTGSRLAGYVVRFTDRSSRFVKSRHSASRTCRCRTNSCPSTDTRILYPKRAPLHLTPSGQ